MKGQIYRAVKVYLIGSTAVLLYLLVQSYDPISAKELDGRVTDTEFSTESKREINNSNHAAPSWFGNSSLGVQQTQNDMLNSTAVSNDTKIARLEQENRELESQNARNQSVNRPSWIPAHAYTNDSMVGAYGSIVPWLSFGRPISPNGEQLRLFRSVSQYWRDGRYGSCMILATPIFGHPGNFEFFTIADITNGPRGWLQDTGEVKNRHRIYRYWFDQ